MLYHSAQSHAYVHGRDYVVPDDIKRLAAPVLAHRVLSKAYRHNGRAHAGDALIKQIVSETPVPV
jgi:MoxR-like ATPase